MSPLPPGEWFPRRGEVYFVRIDKNRPAVVISSNAINRYAFDVCVVPITSVRRVSFSFRVPLTPPEGGVKRDSWAKCDQVTTVEKIHLAYPPLGRLEDAIMRDLERAVELALQLP